jgi:hypothetical protein
MNKRLSTLFVFGFLSIVVMGSVSGAALPLASAVPPPQGVGIGKACVTPKTVGDNIDCTSNVGLSPGSTDTFELLNLMDCVNGEPTQTGTTSAMTCNFFTSLIPPNSPTNPDTLGPSFAVTAITGNAICTPGPTTTSTKCLVGKASNTGTFDGLTLPGTAIDGIVTLRDTSYTITSASITHLGTTDNILPNKIGVTWQDVITSGAINIAKADATTTINKSPSKTETLLSSPIQVGNSFTDAATLSLVTATATGSITYNFYNTGDCTVAIVASDIQTVAGPNTYTSNPFTPITAGPHSVLASYSGDTNNLASIALCEPLLVQTLAPTLATSLSQTTIVLGSGSVSDTAALAGGFSPTGTITFNVFTDSSCTTPAAGGVLGSDVVTGNTLYTSPSAYTPGSSGTFFFQAAYSGDVNNAPQKSVCNSETLTVTGSQTSTVTVLTPATSIVLGSGSVSDKATLTGATTTPAPTGSIAFNVFTDSSCTTPATGGVLGSDVVTANGLYTSPSAFTPTGAGSFWFQATYTSGDANNLSSKSACISEPLTVTGSPTTTATTLTATTIVLGTGSVSDKAQLLGATTTPAPTGSIAFNVFTDNACTTPAAGGVLGSDVVTVNGFYTSPSAFTPTGAGSFWFQATYTSGDANNLSSKSACISEQLTVTPTTPGLSTSLNPATLVLGTGSTVDTLTLSSVTPTAGGTISWFVYSDASCTVQVGAPLGPVPVAGPGNYLSPAFLPATAGTFHFIAKYTGDANNAAKNTFCTDTGETLTVNGPTIPVGGIIVPVDTTALLVAGVLTNWTSILSTLGVVGVAGIAITVIRKRNKEQ